jgi:hypothetical protein
VSSRPDNVKSSGGDDPGPGSDIKNPLSRGHMSGEQKVRHKVPRHATKRLLIGAGTGIEEFLEQHDAVSPEEKLGRHVRGSYRSVTASARLLVTTTGSRALNSKHGLTP